MIKVDYSKRFFRSFEKLPTSIRKKTERKDKIFRENPFHFSLKTHKLKGELNGYWSYSVDVSYRVLFRFANKDKVIYFNIGTHEIYK